MNRRIKFASNLAYGFGLVVLIAATSAIVSAQTSAVAGAVGFFSGHGDVGTVLHPGSASLDSGVFTLTGSGENVWGTSDTLQFVWKKIDGPDAGLSAALNFVGSGGNAHRKAMLMMRQSLDADSPYVDIARHGDGLISLQYRDEKGGVTREVETGLSSPAALRLVKRGDFFYLFSEGAGGEWKFSGAAMKLPMQGGYYVGIGVCAHDKDAIEKATFSKVQLSGGDLASTSAATSTAGALASTLETVAIASTDRRVVYTEAGHFEAPNWLHDESGLLINENGRLERVEAAAVGGEPGRGTVMTWNGKPPVVVDSVPETKLNNDHGLSPDGKWIAFSDSTEAGGSRVYVMPAGGGKPVKITADAPSYFHGWSPDGKTLAFVGERKGDFDIYTVPATGGAPVQLTKAVGFNDGPDYSADGVWIYLNSTRSGHMQIWRMHTDGTGAEQVTHDATEDWFAHPSPDGKSIVFLAYPAGTAGHPGSLDVTLQVMPAAGGEPHLLAKLWGGQGTINVPSWSPDSSKVAFVSYAMLPVDSSK